MSRVPLPDHIMAWHGQWPLTWAGTWATTRYPDDAVSYVPEAQLAAAREEGRRESDDRFREIERLYYAEGKDLSWRAAHMRAIAEEHFALRDKKEPGQ